MSDGAAKGAAENALRHADASAPGMIDLSLPQPLARIKCSCWRGQIVTGGDRAVPEEMPVALTYKALRRL